MCRDGCPVHDFCMDIFDTAREAAPAIQRHRWDKCQQMVTGCRDAGEKGLGGSHVHYR
jgi:hypothetical protein